MGALAVVLVIAVVAERPVPAPATGRPGESGGRPGAAAEPGERPGDAEPGGRPPLAEVLRGLRAAWATPGTRLGFYTHMGTQFSGTVFSLLWGVPFLVAGQGLRPAQASGLLTVLVLAGIVAAPVVGELTARHPLRRSWLVLTVIGLTAAVWTVVLALPPPVPYWLLVVLVVTLALGAPGSIVGFDYARTFNPTGRQGTAVGIVNSGGFSASVVVVLVVGVLLGVVGGPEGYTGQAFRVAWCVQYLVWIFATVGVLRTRRAARRQLAEEDGIVVPPLREALARRRGTGPGR
jgi:MFS family permease